MYVGIDVGGTNLKAGLVEESGALRAAVREPCGPFADAEHFADRLVGLTRRLLEETGTSLGEIASVGIGVPGCVEGGTILYTVNLPIRDIPIETMFRRELDVPVLLGNDADCAALGEYWAGAGRGCRSLVVITLGTGIGGGIVLDGRIWKGLGEAGEVGHMVIERGGALCNCGRRGCWETYASATGLLRMTREAMERCPDSLLWRHLENGEAVGRTAFAAAEEGDEAAREVCRTYVSYVAEGVTNLVNILHPEVLAIGGGVSHAREEALLDPVRAIVDRECYPSHSGRLTRIVRAQLGNDAGILGAALLGRQAPPCES